MAGAPLAQSNQKAALIVAHPGHELRVHHWLEATRPVVLDLTEALAMCRDGRIPDMKTEVGLLRLADSLGYIPQLSCFVDELPVAVQKRYHTPGLKKS